MKKNSIFLRVLLVALPFYGLVIANISNIGVLRIDWICASIYILITVWGWFRNGKKLRVGLETKFILIFFVTYILSGGINTIVENGSGYAYLVETMKVGIGVSLFLAIVVDPISQKVHRKLLKSFVILGATVSVYGVYQLIGRNVGLPFSYFPINNSTFREAENIKYGGEIAGIVRPSSVFPEPSYFGLFVLPILVLSFTLWNSKEYRWGGWFYGLCTTIMTVGVLLSGSYSAYLVVLFVLVILSKKNITYVVVSTALVLTLSAGILYIADIGSIYDLLFFRAEHLINEYKAGGISLWWNSSIGKRIAETTIGLNTWSESLLRILFGVPPSTILDAPPKNIPGWYFGEEKGFVHSTWLRVVVHNGALSFLFLTTFLVYTLRKFSNIAEPVGNSVPHISRAYKRSIIVLVLYGFGLLFVDGIGYLCFWFLVALGLNFVIYHK